MSLKRIFVCSRLRGATPDEQMENVRRARRLCAAVVRAGHAPFAPHIFYTQFLDDNDPIERQMGILAGISWLTIAHELWVDAPNLAACSSGMRSEIEYAMARLGFSDDDVIYNPPEWNGVE